MTSIHPIAIYAEWFDQKFIDHVRALITDSNYRSGFHDAVCAQEYTQWLKSPKWKSTAKLKRLTKPYCERCGTHEQLEVHHTTYDHLGIEVLYLDELVVLCSACHMYEHGTDHAFTDHRRIVAPDVVPNHQLRFSFERGRATVQPSPPYRR